MGTSEVPAFRRFLEAAPDAMVAVEREGVIVFANEAAERLFGFGSGDLADCLIEELVPQDLRGGHLDHRDRFFAGPSVRPMGAGLELQAQRRDGSTFPVEISLSPVDLDGRVLALAAVRDITDRVELERERRERAVETQRQQLQRLESLGQLAGGVAHDFNNLLGVILNYAEFVAQRVAHDATVQADVQEIRRAAERAAELTHQLLAFARREAVRPETLDVNAVLADVERLLRRTLGEQYELVTDTATGLGAVEADRGQLEQVLLNLVVNARDAMTGGGVLLIETADVQVDAALAEQIGSLEPGPFVRVRVTDTGQGMDAETLRRAFEPFFTTKPTGRGTGLGLATVHGIVRQAGGDVHLYSEPGVGTTVSVYLPAARPEARVDAPASGGPLWQGHERILLVEDEDAFREMARRILAESGYNVLVARNGSEAVMRFEQSPEAVDLVVSDVVMPGMSGLEVIERLRGRRPNLPVLLMSGYAEPALALGGRTAPGVPVLDKPFTADELLRAVRLVLETGNRIR
jgi:PAS domain S-box-containing protein